MTAIVRAGSAAALDVDHSRWPRRSRPPAGFQEQARVVDQRDRDGIGRRTNADCGFRGDSCQVAGIRPHRMPPDARSVGWLTSNTYHSAAFPGKCSPPALGVRGGMVAWRDYQGLRVLPEPILRGDRREQSGQTTHFLSRRGRPAPTRFCRPHVRLANSSDDLT